MLTLIEGGFASLAEDELTARIRESVDKGRKTLLFVPEQQTVTAERTMCEVLPPDAPLRFEVTNFTRFVNTSFRSLGGISGEYCDTAVRSLIMWRTLTELSPVLYMTEKSSSVSRGAVESALSAVKEMESLAITQEKLKELDGAPELGGRLGHKVRDLALIYSLYKKTLGERYGDMTEDTLALAELIAKKEDYLRECDIYVDGFTSFTEPQYRLLSVLLARCSVTVRLTLPRIGADRYEYKEVKSTAVRLSSIADAEGCKRYIVRPSGRDTTRAEIIPLISELLWTADGEIDNEYLQTLGDDGGRVRIFSAETPNDECILVAEDIKRRVMLGARYSDFAVVTGSLERYEGILDRALTIAKVPYYFSRTRSTAGHEAVKLIHTAYRIIMRRFPREDVITYMKSGLVGITEDESDECELYIEKWGIDGERFTSPDGWHMNPRGYEPLTEDDVQVLTRLEDVRGRLTAPLLTFLADSERASFVTEHAEALFRFLSDIKLEERLFERSVTLSSLGEHTRAEENSRIFGRICSSLDKLVRASGDMRADAESFENQLSVVLSGELVGTLPSHVDEVTVGDADMLRVREKRHVYLIGVNEGVFPRGPRGASYFTDTDRQALFALGLSIEPLGDTESARALYSFTRAFTAGKDSVTLLYAKRDSSLSPIHPAGVIARIGELTGGATVPVYAGSLSARDVLFTPEFAYRHLYTESEGGRDGIRDALTKSGHGGVPGLMGEELSNTGAALGREAIGIIYSGDLYLSQSRIEAFLNCPFAYFLKHTLKLGEDERAELRSNVIGSFIHCILEDFFREVKRRGMTLATLSVEDKLKITEGASRRFITEQLGEGFGRERTKIAIARLSRSAMPVIEGLIDEFSDCRYEPTFFELSTDGRTEDSASPVIYTREDGKRIIIRGKVDRTDTLRSGNDVYVRVVDYKTGAKDFSPSDLAEGRNLQMFLYLKSIVDTQNPKFKELIGASEGGELIPAGVIYAKTAIKDATVRHSDDGEAVRAAKELSEREGMVLDDGTSLGAMNPAFTPLAYPETSRNKKSNDEKKYTREGWDELCKTIESAVLDVSEEMTSGKIPAEPRVDGSRSACDYCAFRPVCRK